MSTYNKHFARQKIKVRGQVVEVLIMGPNAELPIGPDLSDEMDRVGAQLGYWGAVLADAVGEAKEVDAWYRKFRANITNECLANDPKMAEWKIKARIEASDGFIQHKEAIGLAEKNVKLCEGMVKGYDKKANQLQSKGAKMRTELNAQGMTTPATEPKGWDLSGKGSEADDEDDHVEGPSAGVARPSTSDAVTRMQEINAKKNKRKKDKGAKKPASKTDKKKSVKKKGK